MDITQPKPLNETQAQPQNITDWSRLLLMQERKRGTQHVLELT